MPETKDAVIVGLLLICVFLMAGLWGASNRPYVTDIKRGWFEMEGKLYIVTPAEAIPHVSK